MWLTLAALAAVAGLFLVLRGAAAERLAPGPAAGVVVLVAAVAGAGFWLAGRDDGANGTDTSATTTTAAVTTTAGPATTTEAPATTTSNPPATTTTEPPATTLCLNAFHGFRVPYPVEWYVYELGDPEIGTDPAEACGIFGQFPLRSVDDLFANGSVYVTAYDEPPDLATLFPAGDWTVDGDGTIATSSAAVVPWREGTSTVFDDTMRWAAVLPGDPALVVEAYTTSDRFAEARRVARLMIVGLERTTPDPTSVATLRCRSDALGYEIDHPAPWVVYRDPDTAALDCRFFDPYGVDADTLEFAAIAVYAAPDTYDVVIDLVNTFENQVLRSAADVTVDGRRGVIVERDLTSADGIEFRLATVVIDAADPALDRPAVIVEVTGYPGDSGFVTARRYLDVMLASMDFD